VAVSKSEPLPEDGQVRLKHVAMDRDYNVLLNEGGMVKRVVLKPELSVSSATVRGLHGDCT
jgi:hypothetical protein